MKLGLSLTVHLSNLCLEPGQDGGGDFTTLTRHMLYSDDGFETRLSITGVPQSKGPWPIPHPLSG